MYTPWPGLKRIVRVEHERKENGTVARETLYYLCSEQKDSAEYFAGFIRGHWGIENGLYWHLDVTLKEDRCRVRSGNGAVNLSAMRKYVLELLKRPEDKLSLKRRRRKCMLNLEYLVQIFNKG